MGPLDGVRRLCFGIPWGDCLLGNPNQPGEHGTTGQLGALEFRWKARTRKEGDEAANICSSLYL